jgi:hypothetical protein
MVFVLFLLLASCGYHIQKKEVELRASNNAIIENPKIYIPIFDNNTAYPGAEVAFTAELRNTLSRIEGMSVVNDKKDANLFLLGTISHYSRKRSNTSITGTSSTQNAGGIANKQLVADGIQINISIELKLQYLETNIDMKDKLWTRHYDYQSVYPASTRFEVSKGSTSAPYINDAREKIQIKILAEQFSRQVIDQVVQDF